MLDGPCSVHKGAKHTMREGMGLTKALLNEQNKKRDDRDDDAGKDRKPPRDAGTAFQEPSKTVHTIIEGRAAVENRRDQKLTGWQILAIKATGTIANPRYLPSQSSLLPSLGPTSGWRFFTPDASRSFWMPSSRRCGSRRSSLMREVPSISSLPAP